MKNLLIACEVYLADQEIHALRPIKSNILMHNHSIIITKIIHASCHQDEHCYEAQDSERFDKFHVKF